MDKELRKNIIFQTLFLFVFPAMAIVSLALYVYVSEKENLFIETATHERALTNAGKAAIERSLDSAKNDLLFLSHYHELRNYLDDHKHDAHFDFLNDFLLLMKYRKTYDQIRWIDETGMEKFRTDYHDGVPAAKLPAQLQNKQERYYFKNSVNLPAGAIYVSPFDLNIDHEKVELPYKPMIRVATPLMDIHGHRRGIFIINYLGLDLIERFKRNTAASHGTPMILNRQGYFLKGEKSEDEWGFMRRRSDLTLGHRYPSAWKRIAREESGQFEDAQGLWTFTTVSSQETTSSMQESGWKVVTFVPANIVYKKVNQHSTLIFLGAVLGLLLAGVGSFALAYLYRRKQKALNDFKELQKKTEGILLSVPDIMMQMDKNKQYVWANTQGLMFFGDDVIGHEAGEYFVEDQDTYVTIEPLLEGEIDSVYVQSWQRRNDGQKRLLAWWCRNLKDEEGNVTGILSTARDITEETMLHQEIERIATVDQLTGIYNRHKFQELFALEAERSRRFLQPLSLILIDIDHFKLVNDTHGHDVGDKVLICLAATVEKNIRKIDVFARWGGEEFLVLCPSTDRDNVREFAEKLRTAVEKTLFPVVEKITVSMGVSLFNPEDSFSELFKRADQGLYYAKEHGRNQVSVFEPLK